MLLFRPPGVYRPQSDTSLLAGELLRALGQVGAPPGARVLELGTGTGAVALAAARAGCRVVAVDVSAQAVLAARVNARMRGLPVRVLRGDLFAPVAGEEFDVIVANPPYVAGDADPASVRGRARAWEAGPDGRALLDRICAGAPGHLSPSGTLLMVHSSLNGVAATLVALRGAGMRASVVARHREPFGPVMRRRAAALRARGLVDPDQRYEELVVVRAARIEEGRGRDSARRAA
ncbi:methyltransferase [Actinomadura madurae]|uniref:Release factor glutamine methyltransferase n=2 Tax=Actinomadura TaxID=1988 RepID=A0A1I5JSW3_9ACTN|nr:HemK2/MTQ2 family protein methyltransferase [Actinomadura madurae]SFO75819.1 release factor glutamine methyltransferase [Actinomadura madurae]SPT64257.1 Release factor glutamine methyltransferase [Actinomadura madurae]